MTLKQIILSLGTASMLFAQSAQAGWIDWSSPYTGVMDAGGTTVNVTLSGTPWDHVDGDRYYNHASTGYTSPTGTYAGMAPSDLIRVNTGSIFTLTFDKPVEDLYMAMVSIGAPWKSVTFDFTDPFTVVSAGPNRWGYNGYSVSGTQFVGTEYNGILHFSGTFSNISFSTTSENWYGFNFASYDPAVTVPEPGSLGLLGISLLGLSLARRRRALVK